MFDRRRLPPRRLCVEALEQRRVLHHDIELPVGFTEVEITDDLDSVVAMDIADDGRIFIAEKLGAVRVVKNNVLLPTPFVQLPDIDIRGEHGLGGIVLDPNFQVNNFVYVYYTVQNSSGVSRNRVSRFTANGDVATGDEFILMEFDPLGDALQHGGGAIAFGNDGKLYVGIGDDRLHEEAQSIDSQLGTVLRINPDGSIPTDNPFFGVATGDNRAIFALGVRNPFTMDVQRSTGRVFINDVGAALFEEINEVTAGANFGWPIVEGAAGNPQFQDPVLAYAHGSQDDQGCAITGGAFYEPQVVQFPSDFVGDYFFMDFCNEWIRRFDPATGAVAPFASEIGGFPVDLEVDSGGSLYYLSRDEDALFRIDKPGDFPPNVVLHPADQSAGLGQSATFTVSAAGSPPFQYQWQRDGVDISGETAASYTIDAVSLSDDQAEFRVLVSNAFGTTTSDSAALHVINGQAPLASITAPTVGTNYRAGDTIFFSGTGSDLEDGNLPASAMTWRVDLHHDEHTHPLVPPTTNISAGSFSIPTTGETSTNVFYRVHLTVEDSDGLTHGTFQDISPITSLTTLATNIPGLELTLDGAPVMAGTSFEGVVNIERQIGASSPQEKDGDVYQFVSWSDNGARTHTISTPEQDTTFTAAFQPRVIDNHTGGYSEAGGGWQDIGSGGQNGTAFRASTSGDAVATWHPVLGAGIHNVSIYKPVASGHTTAGVVTISHSGQTVTHSLDFSNGTSEWVHLGEYEFDGSGSEFVSLSNGAGNGLLVADAVEFHNGDGFKDALFAHLPFNEQAGDVAADTSNQGSDHSSLLMAGATWDMSGLGGAVSLDGNLSYVEVPSTLETNLATHGKLTISLNFYVDDATISNRKQLIYEQGGFSTGLNIYVFNGRLYVGTWNQPAAGWTRTFLSTPLIQSGRWHHVALVIDGTDIPQNGALEGWLDGVRFGSGRATHAVAQFGRNRIGRAHGTTRFHDGESDPFAEAFAGRVDELRVFNASLTESEIRRLVEFAPEARAGGPYVINEGDALALDASATFDSDSWSLTYRWDVDGDGLFDENITGQQPVITHSQLIALGVTDSTTEPREIHVEVSDGVHANIATSTLVIHNVAPASTVVGPSVGVPGQTRMFTLSATDPSVADTLAGFEYEIDWNGDSVFDETVSGAAEFTINHVFTEPGTFTIGVVATDQDGGRSELASIVTSISRFRLTVEGGLLLGGTSQEDTILFRPGAAQGTVETLLNGTSFGEFAATEITAFGVDGNDEIQVSSGISLPTILNGGDGDDLLIGGAGFDQLFGLEGHDRLEGNAGDDELHGGPGDDALIGGDGNDTLRGFSGSDTLEGGNHEDLLYGGDDDDSLLGGDSDDQMFGGAGNDTLDGGPGNDTLDGYLGNDVLLGRAGDDVLEGGAGTDALHGGDGDDVLTGGDGPDSLHGFNGNDTLQGGDGPDILFGGSDDDQIFGGNDDDQLFGGPGNDLLDAGNGDDLLSGFTGEDTLFGRSGHDTLQGGSGDDTLDGGFGHDTLRGSGNADWLLGGPGKDLIFGNGGADTLDGGDGRDVLIGGAGIDELSGGAGQDILIGGTTAHDQNDAATALILSEWHAGTSYLARTTNLRLGGGLNGTFNLLIGSTVIDDCSVDMLMGEVDRDWFFAEVNDQVWDAQADELVEQPTTSQVCGGNSTSDGPAGTTPNPAVAVVGTRHEETRKSVRRSLWWSIIFDAQEK